MTFTASTVRACKMLTATIFALAALSTAANAYTDEQQQMCAGDAMRLCSSEIPRCRSRHRLHDPERASLSDGCKAVFRYEPGRVAGQLRAVGQAVEAAEPDPAQARLINAPNKVNERHARPCRTWRLSVLPDHDNKAETFILHSGR